MKHYYTAQDVKEILRLGHLRTAHYRIQSMNAELKAQGYWIERGKIPVSFFHEKYPFVNREASTFTEKLVGERTELLKAVLRDTVVSIMEEEKKKSSLQ